MSELFPGYLSMPEEQEDFCKRNSAFLEVLPHLQATWKAAFDRVIKPEDLADVVIGHLGVVCIANFREILLLAGNGFGLGALRTLRSMYESAVGAYFIGQYPEKADDFLAYALVDDYKLFEHIKRIGLGDMLSAEFVREATEVREKFKRDTGRTDRWTGNLDFVSIALNTPFAPLLVNAYVVPTQHLHPSFRDLTARWEIRNGGVILDSRSQRSDADQALTYAHTILIGAVDTQARVFGFEEDLRPMIDRCWSDQTQAWEWLRPGEE